MFIQILNNTYTHVYGNCAFAILRELKITKSIAEYILCENSNSCYLINLNTVFPV